MTRGIVAKWNAKCTKKYATKLNGKLNKMNVQAQRNASNMSNKMVKIFSTKC